MMFDYEYIIKCFDVPEDISDKIFRFAMKDHYFWGIESDGNECVVSCAVDRNEVYDGNDMTLVRKIKTTKDLIFRNPNHESTLIFEKFVNQCDDEDAVYAVTSLKDIHNLFDR